MNHKPFLVAPHADVSLKDFDPDSTGSFKEKSEAEEKLKDDLVALEELQSILYAQNSYAVLLIVQAMDAAGKDSVIKHVMSGVNPQGVSVASFKAPTAAELDHDYLWRHVCVLPRRGEIGIFNRSYYEEVLIARVHPEIVDNERLPRSCRNDDLWKNRYEDINCFERYLARNGIVVIKFFLNVSQKEQKKRFLDRIDEPEKNWKFSIGDLKERARWDDYMQAYEQMLRHTSTEWAPWYVIPADHKWFTRVMVADIIVHRMRKLDLAYPEMSEQHRQELQEARKMLEKE